ncbi:MAG: OsmC family protein [Geminicoccaceae bacterium]
MADQGTIRAIVERNIELLALKPARAHLTRATKARLVDGLRCEIEEGPWKFAADLPAKVGGDDTAPTPGALGRGALASCLTIGIAIWAARLGVPIDAVEVEVQADFNARAELGMDPVPPGYSEVRYLVSIDSPASRPELDELLALAERHSPYLDVFGRAMALRRVLHVNGVEA